MAILGNLCGGGPFQDPGHAFFEKKLRSDGWGAYFSRKSLGCMAGACISPEKAWVVFLGRVFLEKKPGLHGWGACFL